MQLTQVEGRYGVAKLAPEAALPDWLAGPGLSAMVRAGDELTLVCPDARIPPHVTAERGWSCFRSVGPFAFDQPGVVAALIAPISAAGIGVFVLCTFDGEHILVPETAFEEVVRILEGAGHVFSRTPEAPL